MKSWTQGVVFHVPLLDVDLGPARYVESLLSRSFGAQLAVETSQQPCSQGPQGSRCGVWPQVRGGEVQCSRNGEIAGLCGSVSGNLGRTYKAELEFFQI